MIGSHGHLDTLTGYRIYPYRGLIRNTSKILSPNRDEISDYFFVSLSSVLDISTYLTVRRQFNKETFLTYWFDHSGYRIWGATAQILYSLAESIRQE